VPRFIAEVAISFALMLTVLFASNNNVLSRYTPYFVGALYAIFITLETRREPLARHF
jgi:glycerol uptake facilitator-like aquaporin